MYILTQAIQNGLTLFTGFIKYTAAIILASTAYRNERLYESIKIHRPN